MLGFFSESNSELVELRVRGRRRKPLEMATSEAKSQRISWMRTYLGVLFLAFAAYALTKVEYAFWATDPDGSDPLYLASTLRKKKLFDSDIKAVLTTILFREHKKGQSITSHVTALITVTITEHEPKSSIRHSVASLEHRYRLPVS